METSTDPNELDDFEKELNSYIESEEKSKSEKQTSTPGGQSTMDRGVVRDTSDNEDSEIDDYNLTEDQKRALEELDNLKTEMGYPDEDPPEYDVKERLKVLNEDLKNDPTPLEKQKDSKVGFKADLVDLVAPPPDYGEESGTEENASAAGKSKPQQKQSDDKVDDKSETIVDTKKSNPGKKDSVLIEIDGQFQLVDSDDVRAKDFLAMNPDGNKENKENDKRNDKSDKSKPLQPIPPGKPRPATASASSRRNIRTVPQKERPSSAHASIEHRSALQDFNYNSPYALSPREKQLMEERKKAMEKQKQQDERKKRDDDEQKERENREAFEAWLKKKRESDRRKNIHDEDDRRQNEKEDRRRIKEFEQNKSFQTYDMLYYKSADSEDGKKEKEEAFQNWLKEKTSQFKKEKLLKRRQEQEMHDGYFIRSRDDCEKAYKQWLKHKAMEARKARAAERQKAKLQRLAARRARKSISLSKSIRESNSFRYVDYYGYRF
ncbi:coiled-coil domain-containing protein 181-like isoform X3 [Mya arenaria]|uniref:coiled-coil domain-containing protein 181-like isoform X3 n=1 Tax=Mya arenaria TaxID=6604 RepID=UPI0022E6DA30|nr:coiled-coil domain-containing protein 181-like isoform X3 [Mya arenaria]